MKAEPEDPAAGSTEGAPTQPGESRTFPCEACGADLEFHIGVQSLSCTYCGFTRSLDLEGVIEEQDFKATLSKLAERRLPAKDAALDREVPCTSCGATVLFTGTLTSDECGYCGSPLQEADAHTAAPGRLPVDGVLPFAVDRDQARDRLRKWVRSRWFAPNEFRRRGVQGRFNGVYLPYWTYDAATANRYSGSRGVHYWETTGSGKNRRRERRTRWYPANGSFQRFFDDVLVVATVDGDIVGLLHKLEPWPLEACHPFGPELLAGFQARTYDVELEEGFDRARERIDQAIHAETRQRIGGDVQRIHSIDTRYGAITFKHLLLPAWLLAYRYRGKSFRVVVNAGSGEVEGERPWSWVKLTSAAVAVLAIVILLVFLFQP